MRKLSTAYIALLYILLIVGVSKSTHYCMGKAVDIKYFTSQAAGCMDGEEKQMPCCDDTVEVISLNTVHQISYFVKVWSNTFETIIPEYFQLEHNMLVNQADESFLSVIPPPPILYDYPLYKKQQRFTFYG